MKDFLQLLLYTACLLASPASAQDRLAELLGDGAVMLSAPDGEVLLTVNAQQALVPASIVKIPLAQVALSTFGEDYRFETHFYRNVEGDVLVRGLGDPFLVSEEIAQIADHLGDRGLSQIRRLVMDDSAFEPDPDLPLEEGADDPYAARSSALAVNFNTVNLSWNAAGELISGEDQTPLTPLARELGSKLTPSEAQRINLGSDPRAGLQQAQQLFHVFLEESGITILDSSFYSEALGDEWISLHVHRSSRSLREILQGMLRYSNNFIANQLFLTLGANQYGYPATVASARTTLQWRLDDLYGDGFGQDPERLLMLEGSGLSRQQRSSASGMIRILQRFEPYSDLLPAAGEVLRKSGTLTGVYNYAGYIRGDGGLYPFVILTNQSRNNRDEILGILQSRID